MMSKQINISKILAVALTALAVLFTGTGIALGADWPTRRISLIVPFSAGGGSDLYSRAIVSVTPNYIEEPMVVVLKPGGSGAIGSKFVADSRPDGHTLLFGFTDNMTVVWQARDVGYTKDSLKAIALFNSTPVPINARADAPFKTFEEFVAYAKANPMEIKYASAGVWGYPHLPFEFMQKHLGIRLTHVPYQGGGPALQAILKGEVMVNGSGMTQTLPHIKAGTLRCLAVMSDVRNPAVPDCPTTAELGYPEISFSAYRAVLAPKDTPPEVLAKLEELFVNVWNDKSWRRIINKYGDDLPKEQFLTGKKLEDYWAADVKKVGELLKELKQ
ncbi:MAG: tripartite tricarboxylate transporter substrate binding protein [Lysobacterales bacterium]|nr:MAG: tripartite tricarboxylate transporter substrate binding protein [Xanthomonadales bacterium]